MMHLQIYSLIHYKYGVFDLCRCSQGTSLVLFVSVSHSAGATAATPVELHQRWRRQIEKHFGSSL